MSERGVDANTGCCIRTVCDDHQRFCYVIEWHGSS